MAWQVTQAICPEAESDGSKKRLRPSRQTGSLSGATALDGAGTRKLALAFSTAASSARATMADMTTRQLKTKLRPFQILRMGHHGDANANDR